MKCLLLLLTVLFSIQSYAADEGDWWLQRQIQIGDGKNQYGKKVYGKAARTVIESVPIDNGTREEVRQLIKRSIAVDKPTASKVGVPMLKRVQAYAKSPGAAFLGTLVVTELLEAIGWVMEDGTYVKRISEEDIPTNQYEYKSPPVDGYVFEWRRTATQALADYKSTSGQVIDTIGTQSIIVSANVSGNSPNYFVQARLKYVRPNGQVIYEFDYNSEMPKRPTEDPPPETKTVPLTPELLGAAMLGAGYQDPDPTFDNSKVNTGDYTGVKEIYEHDPSGIGNERAKDMDDKLKNAKPTDDGKSSYIGDPKYDDRPLEDNDDNSDRSWNDDGDTATGETKPDVDPEGNPTGGSSISLQFPLFCSWASKMCQWYDDWKSSDKVYKDHMTKTEEHQTEEKSFWESVQEWFDWTKEPVDEEPDSEQEEPDTQGIFDRTFDTAFSLSKECPPDIPYNFETKYFSGSFNLNMNWLCIIFTVLGYPLVFSSHCIGLWILYEAVIQRQIKW